MSDSPEDIIKSLREYLGIIEQAIEKDGKALVSIDLLHQIIANIRVKLDRRVLPEWPVPLRAG